MFLLPALAAFLTRQHKPSATIGLRSLRLDGAWILVCLVITLMIGYRFEVGGDWGTHIFYLDDVRNRDWLDILTMRDPGYQLPALLRWVSRLRLRQEAWPWIHEDGL